MRRTVLALAFFAAWTAFAAPVLAQSPDWPDDAVRRILADRVETYRRSVGMVVGLIGPEGQRVIAYGRYEAGDARPLDGDTLFEIGSITKVFTALLLADMAGRREVDLDEPAAKLLPPGATMPDRNGRAITLRELSNHRSGLPRLPTNFAPQDWSNPYADYTVDQLYSFLSDYQLPRDIDAQYEYSNLAAGLLGHLLARKAGTDLETLRRTRIADRLGLASTRAVLTAEMTARLASGHDADLERVANWDLPTLSGAGGLRSSARDMLRFLAAALGDAPPDLKAAMSLMLENRQPTFADTQIGLGWFITTKFDDEIVWHDGGTGGYQSFIGYSTRSHRGVVVLSNAQTQAGINDIGRHLLNGNFPLLKLPPEIATKPALLQAYVGRYRLTPTEIFTITREDDRLFAQLTGQNRYGLYAESDRKYFYKVVNAQITFVIDDQGKVAQLILHQNGKDQVAPRIGE
jgi:CubicO group peptidase (beta-lactamase class C family)